ncbi:MAG: hypothetical protein M0Q26_12690 [Chitinophagaceae bacterium]|nr:hypothetical protein [Chitinophagaceae bacterium]MDP1812531.1 hypothetical protein [Sediminibacterium sp.]MDP3128288.1 hypothetical protein [Sediminibacterium sp.]
MKSNSVFDEFTAEYDAWFDRHPEIYQSELLAMKQAVPQNQTGIENCFPAHTLAIFLTGKQSSILKKTKLNSHNRVSGKEVL